MAKVMLVEDDNNLREIYDARLKAEGYEIVSAHDGEEALALAVKERPDLIISDVMMPKISGFDMLDILRSTPETKNTKVIMMTALGQAEDRERADKLGADRYLVKSQVTLEDVIKVAQEILGDSSGAPAPAATTPAPTAPAASPSVTAAPPAEPPAPATPVAPTVTDMPVVEPPAAPAEPAAPVISMPPSPVTAPAVVDDNNATSDDASKPEPPEVTVTTDAKPTEVGEDLTQTKASEVDGVEQKIQDFVKNNPEINRPAEPAAASTVTNIPVTTPDATGAPAVPISQEQLANPSPETTSQPVPEPPSHKKLVLQPTENALTPGVDINALLEKENQKATANDAAATPAVNTVIAPNADAGTASPPPNDIAL